VIAEHVEGPVGRQRPRSCHVEKHNRSGRGRTRLEGGELDALAPLERGQVFGFGMTGASHPLENGRSIAAGPPLGSDGDLRQRGGERVSWPAGFLLEGQLDLEPVGAGRQGVSQLLAGAGGPEDDPDAG
jgi:hypothetical protein